MNSKIKSFSILLIFIIAIMQNCKPKCDSVNSKKEVRLLTAAKNALAGFPQGTNWKFQCVSTGEKDTFILLAQPSLPFDEGSCVDYKDCCRKYYYEQIRQDFEIRSTSGLNKFTGYSLNAIGFSSESSYQGATYTGLDEIYKNFPGGYFNESLTLTISGKTITDVIHAASYNDPTTYVFSYWSAQHGLVKYSYKTTSGTIIKEYERIDLL